MASGIRLSGSVGIGGNNNVADIKTVQTALNQLLHLIPPTAKLVVDGSLGRTPERSKTVAAIKSFQQKVAGIIRPDGRIDVNGRSHRSLNSKLQNARPTIANTNLPPVQGTSDLNDATFAKAAQALGCEVASIRAVAEVESLGNGFLPSKRPKILFEAHIFSRETKRKYDKSNPEISSPTWNRSLYKGGEKEYDRLKEAIALDRDAAIRSASWGRFQIMGFNHKKAGHALLDSFIKAMFASESKQLDAFVSFLKSEKLDVPLKAKDWSAFAKGYNGSGYAQNQYDVKMKIAYEKYAKQAGE